MIQYIQENLNWFWGFMLRTDMMPGEWAIRVRFNPIHKMRDSGDICADRVRPWTVTGLKYDHDNSNWTPGFVGESFYLPSAKSFNSIDHFKEFLNGKV